MTDGETPNWGDFTILIPTLNEAETISQLITALLVRYPGVNLLVIDDVSHDGTQDIVRAAAAGAEPGRVSLIERREAAERGITASILDGLNHVPTPFFLVMDGDLQHPPEIAGEVMAEVQSGADIAAGARLPYRENQGLHRILMTRLATRLAKRHLARRGYHVADPMSGFFGGKTDLVRAAANGARERFEPRGYKIFFDIMRVIAPGLTFKQVHYQFGLRERGHSKLRPAHAFYFLRSMFR